MGITGDTLRVIEVFIGDCPRCRTKSVEQRLVETLHEGREINFQQCSFCRQAHTHRYVKDGYSDREETSIQLQRYYKSIWFWIEKNFEKVLSHNPEPHIHNKLGIIGHAHRAKGKPVFDSELSSEMIKYLNTPKSIKLIYELMENLYRENRELYWFIYLKGYGLTYTQIQETGLISARLVKRKQKLGQKTSAATDKARLLNRAAIELFIDILPSRLTPVELRKGLQETLGEHKNINYSLFVSCPICGGTDPTCELCNGNPDGVSRMIAEIYIKKSANGTWVNK